MIISFCCTFDFFKKCQIFYCLIWGPWMSYYFSFFLILSHGCLILCMPDDIWLRGLYLIFCESTRLWRPNWGCLPPERKIRICFCWELGMRSLGECHTTGTIFIYLVSCFYLNPKVYSWISELIWQFVWGRISLFIAYL